MASANGKCQFVVDNRICPRRGKGGSGGCWGHEYLCHDKGCLVCGCCCWRGYGGSRVAGASTTRWTGSQAPLPLLSVSLWPQVPLRLGGQYPASSHATGFCGAAGSAAAAGGLGSQAPPLLFSQFFLLYVFQSPPPFRHTGLWNSLASWCVKQRYLC